MGGHYGSVQVRSEDRLRVKAAAEQVARAREIHCLVGPALKGWIGIFPENNGQDETVGKDISALLEEDVLHLLVHDDDIFAYWLYRHGELADSFWNKPGYFGEENRAHEEKMAGNPEAFRPIIGEKVRKLPPLLERGGVSPVFASERLADFAKVLGIQNAVNAYEYLKEGDTAGVKGWRQFEEIPADRIADEAQHRRDQRKQAKLHRQRLMKAGLLLVHEERKDEMPIACAAADGFVVAWPNHGKETDSLKIFHQPWGKSEELTLNMSGAVRAMASTGSAARVAMVAGAGDLCVWDVSAEKWEAAGVSEASGARIAISSNGQWIAHASHEQIDITEAPGMERLVTVPTHFGPQSLAIHPSGDWVAVAGMTLGLVAAREEPHWRDLYIGGKLMIAAAMGAAIRSQMRELDVETMEKQHRAGVEAAIANLRKGYSRSKKAMVLDEDLDAVRRQMEENLQKMKANWIALKEGRAPPMPQQAREQVTCVRFSRDGRWLFCGTHIGMRVYEWSTVPRASDTSMPPARWKFQPPATAGQLHPGVIHAIVEEPDAPAIIFSDGTGRLYRMDLVSGDVREILNLSDNTMNYGLALSADGTALAISSQTVPSLTRPQKRSEQRYIWQVWSYPKLRGPFVSHQQ